MVLLESPTTNGYCDISPFAQQVYLGQQEDFAEESLLLQMEEILHHLIGTLSVYQGFIRPRWCRISSINRIFVHGIHTESMVSW